MKIPKFKNEDEEAKFWAKHSSIDYFDDTKEVAEPIELSKSLKNRIIERRKNKKLLTLRMNDDLIKDAKHIAQKKAVGYQTLMRMWIAEGIRREKAS